MIKGIHIYLSFIDQKLKIFRDFWVCVTQKTKTQISRKFCINALMLKWDNVTSKAVEMLFKRHQTRNDSATLVIMWQVVSF